MIIKSLVADNYLNFDSWSVDLTQFLRNGDSNCAVWTERKYNFFLSQRR